jgi:hypothetical protein
VASIKDVQFTEEAFSSQKRTFNTSKHEISKFLLLLWVIFALLDPDPDPDPNPKPWIPDPKHWAIPSIFFWGEMKEDHNC